MGKMQNNAPAGAETAGPEAGSSRGALVADVIVTAMFAGALAASLGMETLQGLVPSIFSSVTLAVMLALLAMRFIGASPGPDIQEDVSPGVAGLWFVLYAAAIIAVGFYVATPIFVFLYLRVDAQLKLLHAVLATLAIAAVLYVSFVMLLHVRPWVGAIPTLIDGFVGGGATPPL